jgi:hypothetical protein
VFVITKWHATDAEFLILCSAAIKLWRAAVRLA